MTTGTGVPAATIDVVKLQPLPEALSRAVALGDDGRNVAELTEAVVHDPVLAARVLALVRGERPENRERPDLLKAAESVGGVTLYALILRATIDWLRGIHARSGESDSRAFWAHSVHCAYLARALADATSYPHPEEAYLAGLLHDLGIAVHMAQAPDQYHALVANAVSETHLLSKELEHLGAAHPELGEALAIQLGLPGPVCDALLLQHAREDELSGTHGLVRIIWVTETLTDPSASGADQERCARLLGVDPARISQALASAAREMQAVLAKLDVKAAAGVPLWATSAQRPEVDRDDDGRRARLLDSILQRAPLEQISLLLLDCDDTYGVLARARAVSAAVFGLKDVAVFFYDAGRNELTGSLVGGENLIDSELKIPVSGSTSAVARAWAERKPAASSRDGARRLTGVDLQIARLLGAHELITLPLVSGSSGLGVMVLGVGSEQAARVLEERGILLRMADLVALALAKNREATERQRARQSEAADRLGMTVRGLVHEARNPLSILKTQLELVRERVRAGAQVDRDVQILREEIDRVGGILARLGSLDVQAEPARTAVNVNRTIQDLLALYRDPLFAERGITVRFEPAPQAPEVVADPDGLKQVLVNLWKNASEAMTRGGQLHVAVSDRVNYEGRLMVEISITDTGPGMVPDTLEGVFSRRPPRAPDSERGFGLSNSYAIVRQLGGHIMCRSQPGRGTTFTLLLPRAMPAGSA